MDDETNQRRKKTEIVALYCQNCVAKDVAAPSGVTAGPGFRARLEVMPCSSKVEPSHLLKILDAGADGVLVVGCSGGRCHFLEGNDRAEKRIERLRRLLDDIHLGADRLGMNRGENLTMADLLAMMQSRAEAVQALGPNPLKGAGT